jgi:hypothetical protein
VLIEKSQIASSSFDISDKGKKWVDSIYSIMNFDERIGQLFMVAAFQIRRISF